MGGYLQFPNGAPNIYATPLLSLPYPPPPMLRIWTWDQSQHTKSEPQIGIATLIGQSKVNKALNDRAGHLRQNVATTWQCFKATKLFLVVLLLYHVATSRAYHCFPFLHVTADLTRCRNVVVEMPKIVACPALLNSKFAKRTLILVIFSCYFYWRVLQMGKKMSTIQNEHKRLSKDDKTCFMWLENNSGDGVL